MAGQLQKPPGRADLTRALVANAATKPVNVVVPAAIVIAAVFASVPLLWPVAVIVYVALVAATFFDADEAEAVGKRRRSAHEIADHSVDPSQLAPPIAQRLQQALNEER